jgi:histidinol-phosphate aminotransferase
VQKAAAQADISSYPDRHSLILREALAAHLEVDVEMLAVGNGSTELIHLLARVSQRPGGKSLVFEPTFGEYANAVALAGGETVAFRATPTGRFQWSITGAIRTIERIRPCLAFLCNPNNPTGVYLTPDAIGSVREAIGHTGLLMLDDAYASLADDCWDPVPLMRDGNLAILRSMTKDHALAGVRIGYLVGEPELISAIRRIQPAWSVNAVAQEVGLAALEDAAHVKEARKVITRSKAYLYRELGALGIAVENSKTNFVLARVGNGQNLRAALLRRGLAVRDCASFGLPQFIRIAARLPEECARLVRAIKEEMDNAL